MNRIQDVPEKKPKTRSDVRDFIAGHFRYYTANSWNLAKSFALNVKVSHLKLTPKETNAAYEFLEMREAFADTRRILSEFQDRHNCKWTIASNGRSSGYFVLYPSKSEPSPYKMVCQDCGQGNYSENAIECGRCGSDELTLDDRQNIVTWPGKGFEFHVEEEDPERVAEMFEVLWDFDQTCEKAVRAYVAFCMANKVEEKAVMVPKKIKVATRR